MKALLHPSYFPNIATLVVISNHEVIWETQDNYQKQTYRNRSHICTDNGRHTLTIPIKHVGRDNGRQKYKDVGIDNNYKWQQQHWRTLQTAYRSTAFFEFYEDELAPLFLKEYKFLMDFNFDTIKFLSSSIGLKSADKKTVLYEQNPSDSVDARFLIQAKNMLDYKNTPYYQLFEDRNGFIRNTNGLDLLFNEGPNTLTYLKEQHTAFLHV